MAAYWEIAAHSSYGLFSKYQYLIVPSFFSNHVMMPECRHVAFELAWSDEPERQQEKCNFGFTYTYFVDFCGHFGYFKMLNMMPRWHYSVSSSERCQEVKIIKTFYAAHISRSQAKSMFDNWTITKSKR